MCRSWEPIYPSRKDVLTRGTAEQIAANNAGNEQWCGVKPRPPKSDAQIARAEPRK
jgi:hypothetical protein